MTKPSVEVQRQILTQKAAQVRAEAFERSLNAELMYAQMQVAPADERKDYLAEIARQKLAAKKGYAAAARCDEMLAALPEPEPEPEPEEEGGPKSYNLEDLVSEDEGDPEEVSKPFVETADAEPEPEPEPEVTPQTAIYHDG